MRPRYILILLAASVGVVFLAFLARGAAETLIILPVARLLWLVAGYYHAFPQAAYWVAALVCAGVLILVSLRLPEWERQRREARWKPLPGPVQDLSFWIQRSKTGIYPKWHIARLLAEMALELLDQRGRHKKHILQGKSPDWSPPEEVRKYLDAALNTNFTDYPRPKRFTSLPPTPFDGDLEQVISYLESLVESKHDLDS